MKFVFRDTYKKYQNNITHFILSFNDLGEQYGGAERNTIKLFDLDGKTINIKSFKVPNLINQIAYRFFRKSKAQRSYEYAVRLTDLGIGTPEPIAYAVKTTPFAFKQSYYVSEHLECDLTYRELTKDLNYPDHENILRAFTRFTFELHEKGINFLDHSPGNTLIKKVNGNYHFYLVDLNRMEFKPMDFEARIHNFRRLTIHKSMIEVMSDEYSKISGKDYDTIFKLMWDYTQDFQEKYHRRRRLKKKLKFWKQNK